jgi:hypothetical protein
MTVRPPIFDLAGDLGSNYTRALRRAADGDRRDLEFLLKTGVPLKRADMHMLADFIQGRFRPRKREGHPRLSWLDVAMSEKPMHRAVTEVWVCRFSGEPADFDDIAARQGVQLDSLQRTERRYRRQLVRSRRRGQEPPT